VTRSGSDPTMPKLADSEFRLLCDLFAERAGLSFSDASFYTFERRLGERVVEHGLTTFHEYYTNLRFNAYLDQELEIALSLVTTAETYFFRQEYQLRSFRLEVLPKLHAELRDKKRITVWSAGCSTGEEVYTLAILIKESGLFDDWEVRVIGSDLCRARVAAARRGVYRDNSFRVTHGDLRARYFEPCEEGWQVKSEIQSLCHFGQLNLLDRMVSTVGRVNVAFCRNVLIYLGTSARLEVMKNLYRRLSPGGYLFLGHSESLTNLSTAFELVHLTGDLVYRKPTTAVAWRGEL
jgi:chemotaxis protein methyltransferase CheR